MPTTAIELIPAKIVENVQTIQYTSGPLATTIIDKFTATNFSATALTISVNLVTSPSTAGNGNLIVKTHVIQAGQTYTFPELVGHILAPNSYISKIASAANSINIRASGREIT